MKTTQEPKYKIENGKLVNRASGEAIPDDEPVFILRARDWNARDALRHYQGLCKNKDHIGAVRQRVHEFEDFAEKRERMKEPDTVFPFSG